MSDLRSFDGTIDWPTRYGSPVTTCAATPRAATPAPGGTGWRAHARDLAAVRDAWVPHGERAVVVGHSIGGGIVLAAVAETGAARMAGVVFAGSGGSGVTAPGLPARNVPPGVATALQRGWFGVLRATALVGRRLRRVETIPDRLVRRFAFAPGEPAELVARVRESLLHAPAGAGRDDPGQRPP